ncbi:hypothetical protein C0J52_27213 [Blattella germanica]|nr:hypothetical protein C0J52_27213 [Blattella germanica]
MIFISHLQDENYSGSRHGGENNFTIINATGCFKERRTIPYSQDAVSFLSNMLDDLKDPNIRSYSSEATDGLSPASKIELEEHPTDGNLITPSINYNYIHNLPEMSDQDASSKDDDSGIKEHSSKELLGKVSPGGPQKDLLDSFDPGYNNRNHNSISEEN